MQWKIEFKKQAAQEINKLDKPQRERIRAFLKNLATRDNVRVQGHALQGKLSNYWRYRVGDYRLVCQIKDSELIILIVNAGHRKDIYK
jgi:mRNA interferase RelE/StbE